jgi:hypothetical protein
MIHQPGVADGMVRGAERAIPQQGRFGRPAKQVPGRLFWQEQRGLRSTRLVVHVVNTLCSKDCRILHRFGVACPKASARNGLRSLGLFDR